MKIFNKIMNTGLNINKVENGNENKKNIVFINKSENKTYKEQKIDDLFKKNNQVLTEDKMVEINKFLKTEGGSIESKLDTIDLALSKDVEITEENLSSIHKATTDGSFEDIVKRLIDEPVDLKKIYEKLPVKIQEKIDVKLSDGLELKEAVIQVIKELIGNIDLSSCGDSDEIPKLFFELDGNDSILELFVIDNAEDDSSEVSIKEEKDVEVNNTKVYIVKKHIDHKSNISEDDELELKKDFEIIKAIEEGLELLEENIEDIISEISSNIDVSDFENIDRTKNYSKILKTEITKKLVELKTEFKEYKKDIIKRLDKIDNSSSKFDIKEGLNKVIDKLDNMVMKSDITLHTDMKTEKDLLLSSSKLNDARELLEKGDVKEAVKIIKEIRNVITKIEFNPKSEKIFIASKNILMEELYDAKLINSIPADINNGNNVSSRGMLELLRSLGLNHESEMSELINKDKTEGIKFTQNMKTVLLKLQEDTSERVINKESLDNLTGHQLVNKLEYKSQKQKMLLDIPIQIDNDVKNLKVQINSKKDNQKMDWKNSKLYFVIHLDKLGDTGILVDINNGIANVTIKNDVENIEDIFNPLIEEMSERLESVGFNKFNINFDNLKNEKKYKEEKIEKILPNTSNKEGVDVRI